VLGAVLSEALGLAIEPGEEFGAEADLNRGANRRTADWNEAWS
jgi:hypothetical protein